MTSAMPGITADYMTAGDVPCFLAQPDVEGTYPAMVLLHERYGLFQHTLDLAAKYAQEGYVCICPDLFWRLDEDLRGRLMRNETGYHSPDPLVRHDVDAALDHLKAMKAVDTACLGIMGVCMSGRYPIVVNAYRDDLAALVMFYGGANRRGWGVNEDQPEPFDALLKRITAPVLCVYGEEDPNHPVPDVLQLRNELEAAEKSYDMKIYKAMPHGWLNSRMPGRYRAEGAKLAWRHLIDFLDQVHNRGYPKDRKHWNFNGDVTVDYDSTKYTMH